MRLQQFVLLLFFFEWLLRKPSKDFTVVTEGGGESVVPSRWGADFRILPRNKIKDPRTTKPCAFCAGTQTGIMTAHQSF